MLGRPEKLIRRPEGTDRFAASVEAFAGSPEKRHGRVLRNPGWSRIEGRLVLQRGVLCPLGLLHAGFSKFGPRAGPGGAASGDLPLRHRGFRIHPPGRRIQAAARSRGRHRSPSRRRPWDVQRRRCAGKRNAGNGRETSGARFKDDASWRRRRGHALRVRVHGLRSSFVPADSA
jgi:hypothetical protein